MITMDRKYWLVLVITILIVFDGLTTFVALSYGGIEANPLFVGMSPLRILGVKFLSIFVFVFCMSLAIRINDNRRVELIMKLTLYCTLIIYCVVVANNSYQLIRFFF